ncbi:MAG: DUF6178 family protein [Deltaproteobacteria bacterium]|nr:DUF6178 family protein [Deltaproteobacteria bacterium]
MTKINLPTERQVGHLTLLRKNREISLPEFDVLTSSEQLNIIRQRQGKEKYDLLINAKNAAKLVPQLHPQEIYLTINELGPNDSKELLVLASPEQITLLLDLDCWENDSLSQTISLRWLELLLGTGEEKIRQLIRELDPEIMALFLKKHLTITRGIEVFFDDDADDAKRLEALYDIDYASEDAAKIIGALSKIWQEQEQESYLLVMEMIRSESLSVFEEEVYQVRNNRLHDLGIIPQYEARSLYAYLDPDNFSPGGKTDFLLDADSLQSPKALLAFAEPHNMLASILGAGVSHETVCELVFLVNRKMSADAIDFSAANQIHEALQTTYDTLNLALEFLAGTDEEKAEEIFNSTYLVRLYQLGHNLLQQRLAKAKTIVSSAIYPYLDYPELLFVDSLLQTPVCFYRTASDDEPSDLQPIRSIRDLELVDLRLEQLTALEELFTSTIPFRLPAIEETQSDNPSLSQFFITAVANQLLERDFNVDPLDSSDLALLKVKTFLGDQLDPEFCIQFQHFFQHKRQILLFFAKFCLDLWEDSLLDTESFNTTPQTSAFILKDN